MVDYTKSKIYKIVCNITGLTYYGSTVNPISKRISQHRSNFKTDRGTCSSRQVLVGGNYDYSLVEEFSCENKDQLHRRERYYIENNECVNKEIPGRTKKEFLEYQKEYREQNKNKFLEYQKEYYEQNKDKILEYREKNRDTLLAQRKEYREQNRDKISIKAKIKVTCECGSVIVKLARHKRSKKHQAYLESQK